MLFAKWTHHNYIKVQFAIGLRLKGECPFCGSDETHMQAAWACANYKKVCLRCLTEFHMHTRSIYRTAAVALRVDRLIHNAEQGEQK